MVLDGPYDLKSLHGGEPRETTNTRKERSRERGRRTDVLAGRVAAENREEKERESERKIEARLEQVLSSMPRAPRLKPEGREKERFYLLAVIYRFPL